MAHRSPLKTLTLRVAPELRGLIERAAAVQGKTRAEFVREASRRAAEEALLDRVMFAADGAAYWQFLERLDAAPRPNARLRATMQTPAPWKHR